MPDPLNWQTRLEVTVDGKVLSPIKSFTPTLTTQATVVHSIEADNIGAVIHPQTATFTMTLDAIGPNVAELTKLALTGNALVRFGAALNSVLQLATPLG